MISVISFHMGELQYFRLSRVSTSAGSQREAYFVYFLLTNKQTILYAFIKQTTI